MEARVGIEPTIEDLQSSALPLGDRAITNMKALVDGRSARVQVKFIEYFSLCQLRLLVSI